MKMSAQGIRHIFSEEGCRLKVYPDPFGYPTIGWGHLVRAGEVFPPEGITQEEADELLQRDLATAQELVNRFVCSFLTINQNQFDALTSLVYNCGGAPVMQDTGLMRALVSGDAQAAAKQMQRWCKDKTGRPSPILVARRRREAEWFLTPVKEEGDAVV